MPLTIVKTNAATKWIKLWKFDPIAVKWTCITQYAIPLEVDDTRFHLAVVHSREEGLTPFYADKPPTKGNKPVVISDALIDRILANPDMYKYQESPKVDFDKFWLEKDRRDAAASMEPHQKMLMRFLQKYKAGEEISNRAINLLKKEGLIQ